MSFKETINEMKELLGNISQDLEKSENGNKAASQRVRTGTVKLEKVAKVYRKESISSERHSPGKKAGKTAPKVAARAKQAKPVATKGKTKEKAKASAAARPLAVKRPTAKLPARRSYL